MSIKLMILEIKNSIKFLNEELEKLREKCVHDDIRIEKVYWGGSYLDKATTTHYTYCNICDTKIKEEIERHSWFG